MSVHVLEAADTIGGGTRTKELPSRASSTTCARRSTRWRRLAVLQRTLDLDIDWIHPDIDSAHPMDDGSAVVLERRSKRPPRASASMRVATNDSSALRANAAEAVVEGTQSPVLPFPKRPVHAGRVRRDDHGVGGHRRARLSFKGERARALIAGTRRAHVPADRPVPSHGVALSLPPVRARQRVAVPARRLASDRRRARDEAPVARRTIECWPRGALAGRRAGVATSCCSTRRRGS